MEQPDLSQTKNFSKEEIQMSDFFVLHMLTKIDDLFRDKPWTKDYYHLRDGVISSDKDRQVVAFITIILRENEFNF